MCIGLCCKSGYMHIDEQIILCALDNLDVVCIYIWYDRWRDYRYHQFDEFLTGELLMLEM